MKRVAYCASKKDFIADWDTNRFMSKMEEGAMLNHIGRSPSEKNSWNFNAAKIRSLLNLSNVPDDVYVAFEYKTPISGRVDCMLFGIGKDDKKHIVHIELKQWSNDTVIQMYETGVFKVSALVNGSYRYLPHPSQQAYHYQQNISNYVDYVNKENNELNGFAYCYNYVYSTKPNDLFAEQYSPIIEKCPLSAGDQVERFADKLNELLTNGNGADIFREFISSPTRPSKNLMNAAANMFKGQEEFVLLDDQLTSCNMIFGMVSEAIRNPSKKMALIVKGGPGTGKTVIALKVLAELSRSHSGISAFFTTRSKALRNTLKSKLSEINHSSLSDASGLIRDIYDFKPHNFKEGEVDVLLVDEAHRIRKSSNVMYDSKDEQTYLPQILSLLYCSKVCVFFIDDHQGVSKEEIGLSSKIIESAENYCQLMISEKDAFRNKLNLEKEKLKKTMQLQKDLVEHQTTFSPEIFTKKYSQNQKRIDNLKEKVNKEYQLWDIQSAVTTIDVEFIELKSQFRCNGSDNYLDWIDDLLYLNQEEVKERNVSFGNEYDFGVCKSPEELEKKIRSLNMPENSPKQIARIVAGYCWKWSEKLQNDGDLFKDVKIGNWSMPWETNQIQARRPFCERYAPSADLWASHPMGINQVGCIYSAQGFEVDYIGVIMGPDIVYDNETGSIKAIKGKTHGIGEGDPDYELHIKNIYRVLLSRGRKGCYIYCCDKELGKYIEKNLYRMKHELNHN